MECKEGTPIFAKWGEEVEKAHENIKKHQEPLTKYDMDRITSKTVDKRF